MNVKTIRRPQIPAILAKATSISAYSHGEWSSDVTGEALAQEMANHIAKGMEAPRMTLDLERGIYTLRYHSNRFYNLNVA